MTAIGHNNPPDDATLLKERLEARYADLLALRNQRLSEALRVPFIDGSVTAGQVTDFIKMLTTFEVDAERARKQEKDAHLRAGRIIDSFFLDATKAVTEAKIKLKKDLLCFQKTQDNPSKTRGEYGAVASLKTEWKVISIDAAEVDLEALRQYLDGEAIAKAARAFVRAGGRELRGAKIEQVASVAVA